MDFLLNEKSLHGQFGNVTDFLESLRPVIKCMEIIHANSDVGIYKIQNFHECKVTEDVRVCDLKVHGVSDEFLRFKISLEQEVYKIPYWDVEPDHDISQKFVWNGEDITATAIAESAVTSNPLLSFKSDKFIDCVLLIRNNEKDYEVSSIHTPKYLLEKYNDILKVDKKQILLIRYAGTRVDCTALEDDYGVSVLEKNEFKELISTLDKITAHESWETIGRDDGLEYKKYSPSSPEENWFKSARYREKTIMKFRFSRVLRGYGYRKGDKFRILRLERDHSISDYG